MHTLVLGPGVWPLDATDTLGQGFISIKPPEGNSIYATVEQPSPALDAARRLVRLNPA